MNIDRENSLVTRRGNAREHAGAMIRPFKCAMLELGKAPSLGKLTTWLNDHEFFTAKGGEWNKQTLSNIIYIDAVQRVAIDNSMDVIRDAFPTMPDVVTEWHLRTAEELREAETIGKALRRAIGYP